MDWIALATVLAEIAVIVIVVGTVTIAVSAYRSLRGQR